MLALFGGGRLPVWSTMYGGRRVFFGGQEVIAGVGVGDLHVSMTQSVASISTLLLDGVARAVLVGADGLKAGQRADDDTTQECFANNLEPCVWHVVRLA